jgi:hypothetical protein
MGSEPSQAVGDKHGVIGWQKMAQSGD